MNGVVTAAGTPAEGLLLNSRMINAVFDDENPDTVENWTYPDTGEWDPERNTDEFAAAVPSYAADGLGAVTIGLQGGRPVADKKLPQTWKVSAFNSDGSIKQAWLDRLDRAIRAAAADGLVVIVSLFYKAQDQRLDDEAAVIRAVDGFTDWLLAQTHANVLVEIGNESNDVGWDHAILTESRVDELIKRVQDRSGNRLAVSTSFTGGYIPPEDVMRQADYVTVHGNNQSASRIRTMVDEIRASSAYRADPKPIVFNEDSTDLTKLEAAIEKSASWGYHDKGTNNYTDGFQAPPVNWTINTATKQAFFARVAELTDSDSEPSPSLDFGPETVALSGTAGGSPVSVSVDLATDDGSRAPFAVDDDAAWLTVTPTEGWTPHTLNIVADPSELEVGTYTATVTAGSPGYGSAGVAVTLDVVSGGGTQPSPSLVFSAESLMLSGTAGGSTVSTSVDLATDDGSSAAFTVGDDAAWLTVAPIEGSTPTTLTLSADPSALEAGTHEATVTVDSADYGSATVAVSLRVESAAAPSSTAVLVSTSPDRSSLVPLQAATVSGSIYAVVEPQTKVSEIRFYLDDATMSGSPRQIERFPAYDFAGTASDGTARPLDTTSLADGAHTITAAIVSSSGTIEVTTAAFVIANLDEPEVDEYKLLVSSSPNRSSALPLQEATASGSIYVFVFPERDVSEARFWLDDPDRKGSPSQIERNPAWDFAGGDALLAQPFETTSVPDGTHTITAQLSLVSGETEVVTATFAVANGSG